MALIACAESHQESDGHQQLHTGIFSIPRAIFVASSLLDRTSGQLALLCFLLACSVYHMANMSVQASVSLQQMLAAAGGALAFTVALTAITAIVTVHSNLMASMDVQASCNDWCLRRELASAYLLERLVRACGRAGVGPGHPDDGADTWTESSYFPFFPSRTQHIAEGYIAPWMQPLDVRLPGLGLAPAANQLQKAQLAGGHCRLQCPGGAVCWHAQRQGIAARPLKHWQSCWRLRHPLLQIGKMGCA